MLKPGVNIFIPSSRSQAAISKQITMKRGKTMGCLRNLPIFSRCIQFLLVLILCATVVLNVLSIQCLTTHFELQRREAAMTRKLLSKPTVQATTSGVIDVQILSSKTNVTLSVNGEKVVDLGKRSRGFNVFVLNQETGKLMAARRYDTYESKEEAATMFEFVDGITQGRIICFAVLDEASNGLKDLRTREDFKRYGSSYIARLGYRDTWALVVQRINNKTIVHAEGFDSVKDYFAWAGPVLIRTMVAVQRDNKAECLWGEGDLDRRRMEFCSKYEGYTKTCSCSDPDDITFNPPPLPDGTRLDLPIAVMASNRPQYLYRMLRSLRGVQGVNPEMVTVYIDGFHEEPTAVVRLFGLTVNQHEPISRLSGRIAQHYKKSLTASFDRHPEANYLIILEEDLDVSVDILSYFRQLLPVLENDESVLCISAWNDQGYNHVVNDASLLYRVETMPGLGWVLSRKLYKGELEAKWPTPEHVFDWDIWMRGSNQRKGRECIIPEISRTFHFGTRGLNVGPAMQTNYFTSHAFNTKPNIKFNVELMYQNNYEKEVNRLIGASAILDHTKNPCSNPHDFIPNTAGKYYVFYIQMLKVDDWTTWRNIARCFSLWDLDVRGFHKDMWRFWIKKNHIMVVGCPASPYCSRKPDDLKPIYLPETETRPRNIAFT